MDDKVYKYYLMDLAPLIREKIIPEKKVNCQYDSGFNMAIEQILHLMEEQAISFEIDLKEINLDK
ncbi:hypothetical protein K6119_11330 [Paracrocinitomix mangrovi]|uniref:hypothetical protein n=1 Tax=Paracrocinitomix mangrovi TaxID=2862509 RepID=UPI001C8E68A2|nr:hypothetical protein [Paracrocinitomix mangrovi]UKN00326.1 hypothetical protein K6119_11330 [Paracrocinitomix mangrovi]